MGSLGELERILHWVERFILSMFSVAHGSNCRPIACSMTRTRRQKST